MAHASPPGTLQLLVCGAGVYATFLTWGLLQERVSTTPYTDPHDPDAPPRYFKQFIFLNLCQAVAAAVVAWLYMRVQGLTISRPQPDLVAKFFSVAFLNSIASPFGYASLRYIDYPTMILGKSCKLVPVMVMGWVLYRKRFPLSKYLAVGLITFGVSVFMLMDPHKKGKGGHGGGRPGDAPRTLLSSLFGLLLLTANLVIDGVTNSTQDRIFTHHKVTGQQMMFFMNVCSATLMAAYLVLSNPFTRELSGALAFCTDHPAVWLDIALFSVCGALGQVFIFYTLQTFGSLVLVTITVTRKMLSIILSVVMFGHVLSFGQWAGVAIVFVGVCLEDLLKHLGGARILGIKTKEKSEDGDGHASGSEQRTSRGQFGPETGNGTPARRGQRVISRNNTSPQQLENGFKSR
ncbi:UAA transporter family-domain-containing protein [Hyaloraphidium curvatum]|nr:UAA transporter family-domain-containing protein [Hyaloraphidium curvatum]